MIRNITKNAWLWFHILGGGAIAKLCLKLGVTGQVTVLIVLGIAILWEIFEYTKDDVESIYGSLKRFYLDAIQDITGAFLMAIIVVL